MNYDYNDDDIVNNTQPAEGNFAKYIRYAGIFIISIAAIGMIGWNTYSLPEEGRDIRKLQTLSSELSEHRKTLENIQSIIESKQKEYDSIEKKIIESIQSIKSK